MIQTLRQLKKYNPDLKTNYFQLTLHALVLILNLVPIVLYSIPDPWLTPKNWTVIGIALIVTETMC
jgi:hypothetical protein